MGRATCPKPFPLHQRQPVIFELAQSASSSFVYLHFNIILLSETM